MGFSLVLFWLITTAVILGIISIIALTQKGLSHVSGSLVSLMWWLYVVAWWSAIVTSDAPRNVRVFSSPIIFYGVLGMLFLGIWVAFGDLFAHVERTPRGNRTFAVVAGLFLLGFVLTRRISISVVVVVVVVVLLIIAVMREGRWLPGAFTTALIALLLVLAVVISTRGLAHNIQPVAPVPADVDEVFYYAPFRQFGWYYLTAVIIITVSVVIGVLMKNVWAGIAVFIVAYLLFGLIVLLTQLVNAFAFGYAVIDAIPGADVAQWISDLSDALNLTPETKQLLQNLASPTVTIEGVEAQGINVDESGYFQWPWEALLQ